MINNVQSESTYVLLLDSYELLIIDRLRRKLIRNHLLHSAGRLGTQCYSFFTSKICKQKWLVIELKNSPPSGLGYYSFTYICIWYELVPKYQKSAVINFQFNVILSFACTPNLMFTQSNNSLDGVVLPFRLIGEGYSSQLCVRYLDRSPRSYGDKAISCNCSITHCNVDAQ